jgi:transposase InsO family protein
MQYYMCVFERTGHITIYFIKTKDQIEETIVQYVTNYVDRYKFKCDQLHADYDTVYRAASFIQALQEVGIYSTFSAPYHHQGNGVAERLVRKVLELSRTLMVEAQATYSDTDMYMALAAWYLNRTPNKKTGSKTPFEMVTGSKPDMKNCVPVGSKAYVHITDTSSRRKPVV